MLVKPEESIDAEKPCTSADGIDMVVVYRAVLRALVCLDEAEYTEKQLRQDDVVVHDGLPDPASASDISQS